MGDVMTTKVSDATEHAVFRDSQEAVAATQRHNDLGEADNVPVDVDVHIINKLSGRKLYAAECANWHDKLGAGSPPSAVDADGNWRITKDCDGFRLVNHYSHRCLYAK